MRGRHSGANPQHPPRKPTPAEPKTHIKGDLMDGRELFEPFTEPQIDDTTKDEGQ